MRQTLEFSSDAPVKAGALQGVKVPNMKGSAIRMASSYGGMFVRLYCKR